VLHNTPMSSRLVAVVNALDQRNWYAALHLAMAMPGLCARLDGRHGGNRPGQRYALWFDRYVLPHLREEGGSADAAAGAAPRESASSDPGVDGHTCWALWERLCGTDDHDGVAAAPPRYEIMLGHPAFFAAHELPRVVPTHASRTDSGLRLHVDVYVLCMCIAKGVMSWLEEVEGDAEVMQAVQAAVGIAGPATPPGALPDNEEPR